MQFYTDGPIRARLVTCLDGHTTLLVANLNKLLSRLKGAQ